jgi:hypothetical protein
VRNKGTIKLKMVSIRKIVFSFSKHGRHRNVSSKVFGKVHVDANIEYQITGKINARIFGINLNLIVD